MITDEQKDRIRAWVKALRSGNYQQSTGALRGSDGYCCLGVACDISGLGAWHLDHDGQWTYINAVGSMPWVVCEWYGFGSNNPKLGNTTAIDANDRHNWSFAQIADALEKEYLS